MRDDLDSTLESKFMQNLQWSMLFFTFNQIANNINQQNEFEKDNSMQKQFIKSWKKFVHTDIVKSDLKIINDILNSPKNIFYSALQNHKEVTESTEIYQEKYNKIINQIEKFFLKTISVNKADSIDEEDEEDD
jgi:hypothetical protein